MKTRPKLKPDPKCPYRCPSCGKKLGNWKGYWACFCDVPQWLLKILCVLFVLCVFALNSGAADLFDLKHFWALGEIESGQNDHAIGRAGEVSRYQILPKVWMAYFPSENLKRHHPEYRGKFIGNPLDEFNAHIVAWLILDDRCREFAVSHHRQPTDFEFYILWARPACLIGFPGAPTPPIKGHLRDRAQRFANLCSRPALRQPLLAPMKANARMESGI